MIGSFGWDLKFDCDTGRLLRIHYPIGHGLPAQQRVRHSAAVPWHQVPTLPLLARRLVTHAQGTRSYLAVVGSSTRCHVGRCSHPSLLHTPLCLQIHGGMPSHASNSYTLNSMLMILFIQSCNCSALHKLLFMFADSSQWQCTANVLRSSRLAVELGR